jgi:hypothetical protein
MRAFELLTLIERDCDERSPAFGRGTKVQIRTPGGLDFIPVQVRYDRGRLVLVIEVGRLCCDLHGRNCEPPSELCCQDCTEAAHDTFPIRHADGSTCSAPDISARAPEVGAA